MPLRLRRQHRPRMHRERHDPVLLKMIPMNHLRHAVYSQFAEVIRHWGHIAIRNLGCQTRDDDVGLSPIRGALQERDEVGGHVVGSHQVGVYDLTEGRVFDDAHGEIFFAIGLGDVGRYDAGVGYDLMGK